ncbi:MAG: hypothetical protein NTX50_17940 [Candidatus Sumerlaeota bacterium]|nr:hypothetical protein [Candidatus Sumerlaeota bacterium]
MMAINTLVLFFPSPHKMEIIAATHMYWLPLIFHEESLLSKLLPNITVRNFSRALAGSSLPPASAGGRVPDRKEGARFSAASRNALATNSLTLALAKACREAVLKHARNKCCLKTPLLKQGAKKSRLKPAKPVVASLN